MQGAIQVLCFTFTFYKYTTNALDTLVLVEEQCFEVGRPSAIIWRFGKAFACVALQFNYCIYR